MLDEVDHVKCLLALRGVTERALYYDGNPVVSVTRMGLSEKAQELLRALPDDSNPFMRDGRRTYLRYDSMIIEPIFDEIGGVHVGYKWRGTVMYRHRIEGFDVKEGTGVLNLWGVEGRMRLIRDGEDLVPRD